MGRSRHIADNPFYVLGIPPDATRAELEGAGQRLLAMLELGLEAAASYETPSGRRQRTADDVRRALAELRDPRRRLQHELWARLPAAPRRSPPPPASQPPSFAARRALGWRRD
jgi:hypothetical protein